MRSLLFDMVAAAEQHYETVRKDLAEYANAYAINVCPYKVNDKIETFSLVGVKGEFIVQTVMLNDEESLREVLCSEQRTSLWKVIAVKGDDPDDPACLCYLYGSDEHELLDVKKL